jgi:hypothetical protein
MMMLGLALYVIPAVFPLLSLPMLVPLLGEETGILVWVFAVALGMAVCFK